MDARLLVTLLLCFLAVWAPAVQPQGAFEDCCLAYHRHIPWSQLKLVTSYHCQQVSGSCNLPAVILFLPKKILCGHPRDKNVQRAIRLLERRRKKNQGSPTRKKLGLRFQPKVSRGNQGSCLLS
ncbi:C-C motif chemokine 25 [Sorex araneus]|uniref:C-C motif chemokine 25 n=1 Tax=Sorex araneus TaxID=42254 RepID=UPI002433E733|nr:C-C motif chemokine 25 [Sorex araneus]